MKEWGEVGGLFGLTRTFCPASIYLTRITPER